MHTGTHLLRQFFLLEPSRISIFAKKLWTKGFTVRRFIRSQSSFIKKLSSFYANGKGHLDFPACRLPAIRRRVSFLQMQMFSHQNSFHNEKKQLFFPVVSAKNIQIWQARNGRNKAFSKRYKLNWHSITLASIFKPIQNAFFVFSIWYFLEWESRMNGKSFL